MSKPVFTQKIIVKYNQSGGAPGEPFDRINYSVEMRAVTYEQALQFLDNIMRSCNGIISETHITQIEP